MTGMIWLSFILGAAAARRLSRGTVDLIAFGLGLIEIATSPVVAAFWKGLTGGAQ